MPGPKILAQVAGDGTGNAVIYTSPSAGGGSAISTIAVVNTTGGALSATVSVVPAATTPGTVHVLVPSTSVAPGDALLVQLGISLGPSQRVVATAATGLNVHVYGTEL